MTTTRLGSLPIQVNTHDLMKPHAHGYAAKDLIVLHETVSPDVQGLGDILSVEKFLAGKDFGIHGMTDAEGNLAWALGLGRAIFSQAGGVNGRSIGIEQVSNIMLRSPSNVIRRHLWAVRTKQIRATARLCAVLSREYGIPLRYSDGDHAGVTTHWSVSQHHPESEGHTDCWPVHLGGYYPALEVIRLAKIYRATDL